MRITDVVVTQWLYNYNNNNNLAIFMCEQQFSCVWMSVCKKTSIFTIITLLCHMKKRQNENGFYFISFMSGLFPIRLNVAHIFLPVFFLNARMYICLLFTFWFDVFHQALNYLIAILLEFKSKNVFFSWFANKDY